MHFAILIFPIFLVYSQYKHSKTTETKQEENNMKEYWVEHEWEDSPWGKRPNMIRTFRKKEDAEAFAATTTDGKVMELTLIEN